MQSIFDKVTALMDEYTEDGQRVSVAETIDMQHKAIVFADMAQKELYKSLRNEKTFNINHKPPKNLLGNQFDQVDFEGVTQTYEVTGAKAYYFEADDEGTAYIDEYNGVAWQTIETIPLTSGGQFVAYKGLVVPSDVSYPIRLRFTGTTYYKHVNRALFAQPYKIERIPSYKEWFSVDLPSDFQDISQIVSEDYNEDVQFRWERPDKLFFKWDTEINYRLIYNPVPTSVTAITDTLECNEIVGQAIVYYIAANISPYENTSLVNTFWQRWIELTATAKAQSKQPANFEKLRSSIVIGGDY